MNKVKNGVPTLIYVRIIVDSHGLDLHETITTSGVKRVSKSITKNFNDENITPQIGSHNNDGSMPGDVQRREPLCRDRSGNLQPDATNR